MHDLEHFTLRDMTECGRALREAGRGATDLENAAQRMVSYLYEHLELRSSGDRSSVLVRLFKTHSYGALPAALRASVRSMLVDCVAWPEMKCLTLMGTAGVRPEWNRREDSIGHRVIPLPDAESLIRVPMVLQLTNQFGLRTDDVLSPDPERLPELVARKFGVFHVPEALGSIHIPAQTEFVSRMHIRSVLGFGGLLPSGELFAVVIFSRSFIPPGTAAMFQTIALSVRIAMLSFEGRGVFHKESLVSA